MIRDKRIEIVSLITGFIMNIVEMNRAQSGLARVICNKQ